MAEATTKKTKTTTARRAGPKRSEASRQAVQAAALQELSERGWRNFSVDRVAKGAKASKQTIYRWWETPACMVVEAAIETLPEIKESGETVEERLLSLIDPVINTLRSGNGPYIWRGVLLAASDDESANEIFRKWIIETIRTPLRHILAEQTNKGLIRRDWEIDFALEALIGPVWQRIVAMRAPLTDTYTTRLVEMLMAYLREGAPDTKKSIR